MFRLTITIKILAGYFVIAMFMAAASLYGLHSLQLLTSETSTLVGTGLQRARTLQSLQSSMSGMELCARVYRENSTSGMLDLFQHYKRNFDASLYRLNRIEGQPEASQQLQVLYNEYVSRIDALVQQLNVSGKPAATITLLEHALEQGSNVFAHLDGMILTSQERMNGRLLGAVDLGRDSAGIVSYLFLFGGLVGLAIAVFAALSISSALARLKRATHLIAEGAFDVDLNIRSRDEIGDLAKDFNIMARRLKDSEQMCLDASPLTRLPGNIAIERALTERLGQGRKFALCYLDLDNFKAFNDRYGYARGSEVIKAAGELIYNARQLKGKSDDFVGHIGGDDFVLITDPHEAEELCAHVTREFDRMIPRFYSEKDLEAGGIKGVDRYGDEREFPLMTISIAIVSNAKRQIKSPYEIAQVAAQIKDFVKMLPGSNYLFDRREDLR